MGTDIQTRERSVENPSTETLQRLRPLLADFVVKDPETGKDIHVYETERILGKLGALPGYVAQETLNGLMDSTMSANHYKAVLDKWGKKDSTSKRYVETPQMVFYRAARLAANGLARDGLGEEIDLTANMFRRLVNREMFPNTPYMANGGHTLVAQELETRLGPNATPDLLNEIEQEKKVREQLFACFVLPLYDSRTSIIRETLPDAAEIQASIGGTGFNFSNLRPANEMIAGTGGTTDGPIKFMSAYSTVLGTTMNQGGKRDGANMFMLDWDHPDIIRFIYSKRKDGEIPAANISIAIDHEFMDAFKSDGEGRFYPLKNPHYNPRLRPHIPKHYSEAQLRQSLEVTKMNKKSVTSLLLAENGIDVLTPWLPEEMGEEYRVIGKVKDGTVYLDAKKIMRHLSFSAWFNGEPGMIITGHINDHNPTHTRHYEQFLLEQGHPQAREVVEGLRVRNPEAQLERLVHDYVSEIDDTGRPLNLPPGVGIMRATNPCGEKPLLPHEACVLGHTNLEKILRRTGSEGCGYVVDWDEFEANSRLMTRILDNAIDQNSFTNPQIELTQKSNRKIGVGFMGLANMLYRLELPYDSQEARNFVDNLLKFWEEKTDDESFKIAEVKGPYPNFIYGHHRDGKPKRNAIVRTLAPTGTTGFAAQTTGGMEPEFALAYTRRTVQGTEIDIFNPVLQEKLEKYNFFLDEVERERFHLYIAGKTLPDGTEIGGEGRGSLQGFEIKRGDGETEIKFAQRQRNLSRIKEIFVIANDIPAEDHIRMQAVVQGHVDDSISKTTNFRNNATVDDIERAFVMAYDMGIKGITFYRDGARKGQPLQTKGSGNSNGQKSGGLEGKLDLTEMVMERLNMPRPDIVGGLTEKGETPFGMNVFVTLNWEKDEHGRNIRPYEAFISIGKGGGDLPAIAEGYGRALSLALKAGIPVETIASQLEGIGGESQVGHGENRTKSFPDAVAKALRKALGDESKFNGYGGSKVNGNSKSKNGSSGNLCLSCGKMLVWSESCEKCPSCAFSKC